MKLSLLLVLAMAPTWGQGVITTVAGADWIFNGDGKPALDAPLGSVRGIAIDPADGRPVFADPDNCIVAKINADGVLSVIAGDLIQIYAVGLGVTTQTLGDQELSPAGPLAVVPDYSVNVGGTKAELAFAGLTPGLTGLYQVHFRVPPATASGNVPVTITVGGQTSPAVNLPVR